MKKQINFRLDDDLVEKLREIAEEKRTTITSIIKQLIKDYLLEEEKKRK